MTQISRSMDATHAAGRGAPANRRLDADPKIVWARSGDHVAIGRFLLALFQKPSPDEFQSSLDDPFYEPTDRLLVKRNGRVCSHLHLVKRTMHYGRQRLAGARVTLLGTLPEFRCRGYARRLLAAADRQIVEDGGALGLLTTSAPRFFAPYGWAVCSRDSFSRVSTRDVLSALSSQSPRFPLQRKRQLNIRHWRHFELEALERVYRQNTADGLGAFDRSEAYWQWLISRRSCDQIFVAIDGPDRLEFGDGASPIVGYAVTKAEAIVELMTAPTHPDASVQLFARACADAIEHDLHSISLHAPPDHPLHELIVTAGGAHSLNRPESDCVHMVKLVDPARLFEKICPELHRRAGAARLSRPSELGFVFDDRPYRFLLTRRSVKVIPGACSGSCIRGERNDLTRLVMGQLDLPSAVQAGRVSISDHRTFKIVQAIFPRRYMWRPPFDQMPI